MCTKTYALLPTPKEDPTLPLTEMDCLKVLRIALAEPSRRWIFDSFKLALALPAALRTPHALELELNLHGFGAGPVDFDVADDINWTHVCSTLRAGSVPWHVSVIFSEELKHGSLVQRILLELAELEREGIVQFRFCSA